MAAAFDVGVPYAQAQLFAGYGKPHWQWAGLEARASTTMSYAAGFLGLHGVLPFLDGSIGVRDTYAYDRSFLLPRARHGNEDIESAHGANARYLALDLELSGVVPVPGGFLAWDAFATRTLDAPAERELYEELLRVIMRPPIAAQLRFGYALRVASSSFGPVADLLAIPHREGPVVRVGGAAEVPITDHLRAEALLTIVVRSPDGLDVLDGAAGVLGVRYQWASGEQSPRFP